jgi:FkbH-like protein
MKASINIPIDPKHILRKKKSLKRLLIQKSGLLKKRIAILGGSTTAEIRDILEIFLLEGGIEPEFYESEYNQYYNELAFENDPLKRFAPDVIFIHTTGVNIHNYPSLLDTREDVKKKLDDEFAAYSYLWGRASAIYGCPIIQNNFENPFLRPLGNLDFSDYRGKTSYLRALNERFAAHALENPNFYIHDIHHLSAWLGLERWFNRKDWYSYKLALAFECIPAFAQNLAAIIKAIFGNTKKALVLDLDNTLWGGVIGDDGADQIKIGNDTAVGEAHWELQAYLLQLRDRGILLTVSSKNDYQNAREGFNHPHTVLKFEDFAAFQANWEPKSENIKTIANQVNIGIDSLVFLDDNPSERELVMQQLPEVTVPDVGNDIENYAVILDRSGLFEPISISNEDLNRARYYEANATRNAMQSHFLDYGKYLDSLEMSAKVLSFEPKSFDRITQLTNKTNQFNLTTRRYTNAEIEAIAQDPNMIGLSGHLKDKFGDNGLVSVVIATRRSHQVEIDLWLMSCRVLKRDMELAMFDALVARARRDGTTEVIGKYLPTKKNGMVADLYSLLGFENIKTLQDGETHWRLSIPSKQALLNSHIKVNNGQ